MPYPIVASDGPAGLASYQLGGNEEWTLLGVSFYIDMSGANGDDSVFMDCRDPSGGIIYRQNVDYGFQNGYYSLSPGSEPTQLDIAGEMLWPQSNLGGYDKFMTERLSPVSLTPGCIVNVYVANSVPFPPADPITDLDVGCIVKDLHLWVEDTVRSSLPSAEELVGPYMLVPGPGA